MVKLVHIVDYWIKSAIMDILIIIAMGGLWALAFWGFALVMEEKNRIWGIIILVFTSWCSVLLEKLSGWSYEVLALSGLLCLALSGGVVYGGYYVFKQFLKNQ